MDYKEKVIALLNSEELSREQKEKLEVIFPELKESEDERIRKEILSLIRYTKGRRIGYKPRIHQDKMIAWLERQGEQKPAWSEEDETTKNNISHIIRQYDKISKKENQPCWYVGDCLLWMQNIKDRVQPQPKQEWNKEDEKMFKSLKTLLNEASCYSCTEGVDKILAWLKQKIGR